MVTESGKAEAVPSVHTPPAPKGAPVRSPLFTALTGKLALQVLEAEATAPTLASATLVGTPPSGALLTVCANALEVAAKYLGSPEYTAVIEWVPTARPLVVHVARLDASATAVHRSLAPSLKVMVPVAGNSPAIDAVKVTPCPAMDGLADEARDTVG